MVSSWRVQQVARVVREGGVIAYPTEALPQTPRQAQMA